ncbi:MAG: PAS domain-containing protein [bacterium]|nr:PAS domain-containing protein [bacterium]
MSSQDKSLTGVARTFGEHELIVSKTDLHGKITYANDVFLRVAQYTEEELLGSPHSIVRHPHMPRCVYKLLWDTIQGGNEIFAYVVNRSKLGDHYWVLAHVTPSFDIGGNIISYHSSRRKPDPGACQRIEEIYRSLLDIESRAADKATGMARSTEALVKFLNERGVSYEEFVFTV